MPKLPGSENLPKRFSRKYYWFADADVDGVYLVFSPSDIERGRKLAEMPEIRACLPENRLTRQALAALVQKYQEELDDEKAFLTDHLAKIKALEVQAGVLGKQKATMEARIRNQEKYFNQMTLWQHIRAWWRCRR